MALSFSNGGASRDLGLKILRCKERGAESSPELGQALSGPVWSPIRSCGSSSDYALCPLHLHDFGDVILASKIEVLHV
jgi:hypothetical protein